MKTFYPTPHRQLKKMLAKLREGEDQQWVSEAPSSVEVYTSAAIPGLRNSLLITTLKTGKLMQLKLSEDGSSIVGDTITLFKSKNRYRDLALSPDGKKIYLAVDSISGSSEPAKDLDEESDCSGCIIEYTFQT